MKIDINELIEKAKAGFTQLSVDQKYQNTAIKSLQDWLTDQQFQVYVPQISYLINSQDWDYLLDCFYQIIPFGTGGRRGEIGIGPNRINTWTIQASAQGHSQYLIKQFGGKAKQQGVVLAYGVREFFSNGHFNNSLENPVKNLTGKKLAEAAAQVYTANGIKTFLYESPRTTPQLSFSVRYLQAISGDMFDASHNSPEHNGKKVYDQYGGQLIPPFDEALVKEVTQNVKEIKIIPLEEAIRRELLEIIGAKVDQAYLEEIKKLSLSDSRNINIVYTPLHGVGITSIEKVLEALGFNVQLDPKTGYYSGKFENVTFNIPNPEVQASFDTTLKFATTVEADLILNSDPDADRIGVMVKHKNEWKFLNGNEIGAILTAYAVQKRQEQNKPGGVIIKTTVTTNLATRIAENNGLSTIGELLVGFKYIGEEMNKLEKEGKIDDFVFGLEESHGYIAGNYVRDKDAAVGAIWLSELAAELKKQNKTLVDYLNAIYTKYGYYRNYLTEIRLPGAEGMEQIAQIQDELREHPPKEFNQFIVEKVEDCLERKPIVSETDKSSKNVLIFHFATPSRVSSIKATIRPSGTEPKSKLYLEIGSLPLPLEELEKIKKSIEDIRIELEKVIMKYCYKIIGVDFPDRGFLLFWQLPLKVKMKYFEIEEKIISLKNLENLEIRKQELNNLLSFLGSDPTQKVNQAFEAKFGSKIEEYLNLNEL